ncbi:GNAT family N-acetyltransferase [Hydrocarboniphaga sp.]|uniref:GNAT family N-acetyltransferase n=1 Tax=Hydrocarboniphaga sp. TaxID=2033016 RepID=UPI0034550DB7
MRELRISTDSSQIDVDLVHRYLSEESYWAKGIPRETVERSLAHSLCFGGYIDGHQVAFARVISDYATFAYLGDVFVLPEYRGSGYSKALMQAVIAHPQLQGLRRFMLATSDAHGLYAQFGFAAPAKPQTLMECCVPDIYKTSKPIPPPQRRRSGQ